MYPTILIHFETHGGMPADLDKDDLTKLIIELSDKLLSYDEKIVVKNKTLIQCDLKKDTINLSNKTKKTLEGISLLVSAGVTDKKVKLEDNINGYYESI